jgi:hypothetical protein
MDRWCPSNKERIGWVLLRDLEHCLEHQLSLTEYINVKNAVLSLRPNITSVRNAVVIELSELTGI